MDILIESTKGFENDLTKLSEDEKTAAIQKINDCASLFPTQKADCRGCSASRLDGLAAPCGEPGAERLGVEARQRARGREAALLRRGHAPRDVVEAVGSVRVGVDGVVEPACAGGADEPPVEVEAPRVRVELDGHAVPGARV